MRTIKRTTAIFCAALLLWACDVNDPIYDNAYPGDGKIALITDWTNRGEGIEIPSSYTVTIGDYSATLSGTTNTIDNSLLPGTYRLYVYNTADNIAVSGTTATADYTSQPGWFFTCAMDATVAKGNDHSYTAIMQQQVRQLTIALAPAEDTAEMIESITATLSGVAGTLDIEDNTLGTESTAPLTFIKDGDGLWKAAVRLLGITGENPILAGTIKFAGGSPSDMAFESNLADELAGFNTDKTAPLALSGKIVETHTPAGFTATITDWTVISGNIVAVQVSATVNDQHSLRVAGASWTAGDAIGIFMLETGTDITQASNREYITSAGDGNFTPSAAGQTIYYPIADNAPQVDFAAYYPYSGAQTGLTYAVGLADQSNQAALDLLTADKVAGKDKAAPAVALKFKHRLVKMELTLQAGTSLTASDLAGMSVSLSGQYTAGACNLNTGAITASGNAGSISLKTQPNGLFAEATLLPAAASAGRVLTFTLASGDSFHYEIPANQAFNAGEKHSYTTTLNLKSVDVTASITDWVSVPGTGTAD